MFVKTFGCQMNEYDSEKIFALLSADHRPVSSAEEADFVFVNTCSVREKGEHKLFSLLGRLRDLKESKPNLVVGVGGCVAQQEGKNIIKRAPSVDFVVGTHNLSLVPSLLDSAKNGVTGQVAVDYRDEWEELPEELDSYSPLKQGEDGKLDSSFGVFYSPVRAMVAIQRGCNKNCSFCVVPTTRGPEVSRSFSEIEREIKHKVAIGAREVMLLGQTVNSWGRDLQPRSSFEELVKRISEIDKLERIRFTSPHPAEVRPGFIDLYATNPKLCPSIHMPLQSGSNRLLKEMNRNYKVERYLEIVDQVREVRPDIAISTDIIVGFPGETEDDFEQTMEVIEKVRYQLIYSFVYSPRPNTVALDKYGSETEPNREVAGARLCRLQARASEIAGEINSKRVGQQSTLLIEKIDKKSNGQQLIRGRSPENVAVEVDLSGSSELSKVNSKDHPVEGSLLGYRVTSASPHGLYGETL